PPHFDHRHQSSRGYLMADPQPVRRTRNAFGFFPTRHCLALDRETERLRTGRQVRLEVPAVAPAQRWRHLDAERGERTMLEAVPDVVFERSGYGPKWTIEGIED